MLLAMLSKLLCTSRLIQSCLSRFTVKILIDFFVTTVAGERSRLVPLKAIPTGRSTPLANAAVEIPPVITVGVIRPVSTMPVFALNLFISLDILSQTSISLSKYASISINFLNDMFVILVVP